MAGAEDSQAGTVAWLASSKAHDGAEPERIDTHISRIFMAGDRVLKLKRAVRFPERAPVLDFTTVDARRKACVAELEVNRRTAPDLYLGMAPVLPGPRLGELFEDPDDAEAGDAVDWVVVMDRFDQDALLDSMAKRDALDAETVDRLAETVAAFHADAERKTDFGGAAPIAEIVEDVTEELARCAPDVLEEDAVAGLRAALQDALEDNRTLLDRRAAEGFVRHCHGDLHLRNICLLDGAPVPFDAIEFNPALANTDVLYDLAFLLMDLAHRGLGAAANRVLNLYLPHEGDYAGLAALPLFMALRAAIRAEIAAGRAKSGEDGEDALAKEARGYVSLARDMLESAPPRLVAVGGLSGTGKSAVAAALAPGVGRAPGAVVVRSDVLRKRLSGLAPTGKLGPDGYTEEATRRTYAAMAEAAGAVLDAGFTAIADAVHARSEERAAIEDCAGRHGCAFDGLWLEAPEAVRLQRVGGRRGDASDADASVAQRQSGYDTGAIEWHRIAACRPLDEVVAACRRALKLHGKRHRV